MLDVEWTRVESGEARGGSIMMMSFAIIHTFILTIFLVVSTSKFCNFGVDAKQQVKQPYK
jgi:hypothetical protein